MGHGRGGRRGRRRDRPLRREQRNAIGDAGRRRRRRWRGVGVRRRGRHEPDTERGRSRRRARRTRGPEQRRCARAPPRTPRAARGFDCCSGTCTAACASARRWGPPAADGGAVGGSCGAPAAACTMGPRLLQRPVRARDRRGRRRPCRDACRADGVACTTAQDCCSLGCFGGVCAQQALRDRRRHLRGQLRLLLRGLRPDARRSARSTSANSRCRPTGEDCGKGPQSGCCGATKDDDLCDDNGRCGLPPGACRGQKADVHERTADCCSSHCDAASKTCTTVCTATGGTCARGRRLLLLELHERPLRRSARRRLRR